MVPRAEVPRSTFVTRHSRKVTFDGGFLIPFFVDEILPGDVHKGRVTIFARLATMLFPLMDNVTLETFFFFVPNRLLWSNWVRMMGEQTSPGDTIAYTTPQIVSPAGGFAVGGIFDYFGLPTVGQVTAGQTVTVNALPLRAYRLIYHEWFRDQDIDGGQLPTSGDGPDVHTSYSVFRRRKRHDYFTSCRPWPLKGGVEVPLPISGQATVRGIGMLTAGTPTAGSPVGDEAPGTPISGWSAYYAGGSANVVFRATAPAASADPLIYADLSTATGATLNALRLAIATQRLLEMDARGGTRYVEILYNQWGVDPEDWRLQRPEYVGGGRSSIQTSAIPQSSATNLTGGSTALGTLAATGTFADQHEFSLYAREHGYLIGLVNVTADLTYQQGLHKMWSRQTRYDFYHPAFANLGEQAVLNQELYVTGTDATDTAVFGYQERWSEYRHRPSTITGLFRSTSAGTLEAWHAAQKFTAQPTLNGTFIEDNPPFSRVLAAGAAANGAQVLFDSVFDIASTRALPMYSVPGLDRF
uniref:Putative capsid VP1 n=1 Tax=uncultured virus TaxID=340016 RepID=A0A1D8MK71_9VIRU|nr:putative capsid VP1 [uncultured virus]